MKTHFEAVMLANSNSCFLSPFFNFSRGTTYFYQNALLNRWGVFRNEVPIIESCFQTYVISKTYFWQFKNRYKPFFIFKTWRRLVLESYATKKVLKVMVESVNYNYQIQQISLVECLPLKNQSRQANILRNVSVCLVLVLQKWRGRCKKSKVKTVTDKRVSITLDTASTFHFQ